MIQTGKKVSPPGAGVISVVFLHLGFPFRL